MRPWPSILAAAWAAITVLAGATAAFAETSAAFTPSPDAIRSDMTFLASDATQGRETATDGYDIAAAYVAMRYGELGLKQVDGVYFQPVPLVAFRPAGEGSLVLRGAGGAVRLAFGDDYLPQGDPTQAATRIAAPMVFVGYGVVAPERGRDDYAGLDAKGKVVVLLVGAPKAFPGDERAYHSNLRLKRLQAQSRGAVGFIVVDTPTGERLRPFSGGLPRWRDARMTWQGDDGETYAPGGEVRAIAGLSPRGAAKLFAGAAHDLAEVMAAAEAPAGDPPRFDLPWRLDAELDSEITQTGSFNLVGLIEGADPKLKHEVVVLSAHLDHVGIGPPINGDAIHNGAIDNAGGVATLLEVARGFAEAGRPPRRSILILALTAEEKGMVGSEYFVRNPPRGLGAVVANINLDMPLLTQDFTDVVALGGDRSTIGAAAARVAAGSGLGLAADPMPDQGLFLRSDHYRFVERGIPSVLLMTGPGNGGLEALTRFLATRYHQPSDDMNQPIDFTAAARFAAVNYALARELADADERPAWRRGDFFGGLFAPR